MKISPRCRQVLWSNGHTCAPSETNPRRSSSGPCFHQNSDGQRCTKKTLNLKQDMKPQATVSSVQAASSHRRDAPKPTFQGIPRSQGEGERERERERKQLSHSRSSNIPLKAIIPPACEKACTGPLHCHLYVMWTGWTKLLLDPLDANQVSVLPAWTRELHPRDHHCEMWRSPKTRYPCPCLCAPYCSMTSK